MQPVKLGKEALMMTSIGREFVEKTKYQYLEESDQSKGLLLPSLQCGYDNGRKPIDLPDPHNIKLGDIDFIKTIEKRRSLREYSGTPLTVEELSYLLWCSQGVRNTIQKSGGAVATLRNVPSAGSRHAFETYILINNVNGLPSGLYRFLALEHKLIEENMSFDIADKIAKGCLGQKSVKLSAATFIWTAVPHRMNWKYGERGYRYLYLDAGHVCQNLYLSAETIGCGACAIGAFSDDDMNSVLGLDGEQQFVIYAAAVGKR